jgi:FdhE protein
VSGSFLDKMWRRSPAVSPALAEVAHGLRSLAREQPAIAGPATLLADVLPCLFPKQIRETPPALTPEQARAKLIGGIPLLRGERVPLDTKAFGRRWQEICAVVGRHRDGDSVKAIAKALGPGQLDPLEIVQDVLAGRMEAVHGRADALGLDAPLTGTVLRWALFPVLATLHSTFAPVLQGALWKKGICPTCGSWPLLGEFRGLEQTRFLRCGLCASEWEFPRLRCPFCDNRDHRQLGYFHVEGEEDKQRAATCDACRGYVKMVSTLARLSGPRLLLTDMATLHLDLAAAERGYFVG